MSSIISMILYLGDHSSMSSAIVSVIAELALYVNLGALNGYYFGNYMLSSALP